VVNKLCGLIANWEATANIAWVPSAENWGYK
jgi:hypothetical protein